MNEQVIEFLKGNPNSNKAAITAATVIKGLPLPIFAVSYRNLKN